MMDDDTLLVAPDAPEPDQDAKPVHEQVQAAVDARDGETLVTLLDPLAPSAALRQLLLLNAEDRNALNLDNFSTFSDALLYHLVQDAKLLSWNTHEERGGEPLILHFGEVYFEF